MTNGSAFAPSGESSRVLVLFQGEERQVILKAYSGIQCWPNCGYAMGVLPLNLARAKNPGLLELLFLSEEPSLDPRDYTVELSFWE